MSEKETTVIVASHIEPETRDKFKLVAKRNGRTVSGEIRFMVERSVEAYERRQEKRSAA